MVDGSTRSAQGTSLMDGESMEKMMSRIFLLCSLALSQAGYVGHYYQAKAHQPIHIPVIDQNGVPVDTPEVQAAKAQHYGEYAKTLTRPGQDIPDFSEYNHDGHYAVATYTGPAAHAAEAAVYPHTTLLYKARGVPPAQIGHDGQPLETYEVQAAKAAHFAAHADAAARSGYHHYRTRRGIHQYQSHYPAIHIPLIDHTGVPVETPEVQAAKSHHFNEYSKALNRPGQSIPDYQEHYSAPAYYAPVAAVKYSTPTHYSALAHSQPASHGNYAKIGHDGRPVETPEVQAAKIHHFTEYSKVLSRPKQNTPDYQENYSSPAHYASVAVQYSTPAQYLNLAYRQPAFHGHYAKIGHDGRPIETYEVQAAKAAHLAAHAHVQAQNVHFRHY